MVGGGSVPGCSGSAYDDDAWCDEFVGYSARYVMGYESGCRCATDVVLDVSV